MGLKINSWELCYPDCNLSSQELEAGVRSPALPPALPSKINLKQGLLAPYFPFQFPFRVNSGSEALCRPISFFVFFKKIFLSIVTNKLFSFTKYLSSPQ